MLPVIEKLLSLQDRDQRIKQLRAELDQLPIEQKTREAQLAAAQKRLETARARSQAIEVERRQLETEVQGKQETIARYKTQQMQTRKNEEYTALRHEIETAEKKVVEIEDRELGLMEEAENLKPTLAAAEQEFQTEKSRIEELITLLEEKRKNIDSRLAELTADREQLATGVEDEDFLDNYQRLFRTKAGSAVVGVEHEVCGGCHMKVTSQTVVQLKGEKSVIHCPNCGRMLYLIA